MIENPFLYLKDYLNVLFQYFDIEMDILTLVLMQSPWPLEQTSSGDLRNCIIFISNIGLILVTNITI